MLRQASGISPNLSGNVRTNSSKTERQAEETAQSLCISCGLCCDGTLFDRVDLTPKDDFATLASLSIHPSDTVPPALKQCCAAYKHRLCSIYPNRPHACRRFRCALLKRFEADEISHSHALKVIREAVALRDRLREGMASIFRDGDCTLNELPRRLKAGWKAADSAEAKHSISNLFEKFAALWLCVNKHFKNSGSASARTDQTKQAIYLE